MAAHLDGVAVVVARASARAGRRRGRSRVTLLRRLDHVAILVRDTDEALRFYQGRLGLAVASSEEIRLPTCGSPTWMRATPTSSSSSRSTGDSPLRSWLDEHGEGLHHICFGVDDVPGPSAS